MGRTIPGLEVRGWRARTEVERAELFTRLTLFALLWCLVGLGAFVTVVAAGPELVPGVAVAAVALAIAGTPVLRSVIRRGPGPATPPRRAVACLGVTAALAAAGLFLLPGPARLPGAFAIVTALVWSAGGSRDRRVQAALLVASAALTWAVTGSVWPTAYALVLAVFLAFSVQSSLWLLGVVTALDEARADRAALAVAEERLRFSRDVHDVMGRRLATIAVQAELAAALAAQGDRRASTRILDVRQTAHLALGEARELSRGYRPPDLATELGGAVALLRSAGIEVTSDVAGLPDTWHDAVSRVVRESVTNVLRHSEASTVSILRVGEEVVIRNDGARSPSPASDGTGLRSLRGELVELGCDLSWGVGPGDVFEVRLRLAGSEVAR